MVTPGIETDWQAVALFLAGLITEEKPSYTLLIFQVIADCSKTITTTLPSAAERITAS